MSTFDWAVLIIGVLSVLSGLSKGIMRSLAGIAGLLVGIYLATNNYQLAAEWLRPWVESESVAGLAGFLLIMTVFLLLGAVAGRSLQGLMRSAEIGWVDRTFGAGFGFIRGWIVASAAYLAITAFSFGSSLIGGSVTGPYLRWGADRLIRISSSEFSRRMPLGWGGLESTGSGPRGGR